MKRTYISTDNTYTRINGTFNMIESKSFFGSKMMDIEDVITISNDDIIYYQNNNKEQINLSSELLNMPVSYSPSISKFDNSIFSLDKSQTDYSLDNDTKWNLSINLEKILTENIFSKIKLNRSFEGIVNTETRYDSVDLSINDYIKYNIISRYKIKDIILYIRYNSITNASNMKYSNKWDKNISSSDNILKKFESSFNFNKTNVVLNFKQEKISKEFCFDYYYDLVFEKV